MGSSRVPSPMALCLLLYHGTGFRENKDLYLLQISEEFVASHTAQAPLKSVQFCCCKALECVWSSLEIWSRFKSSLSHSLLCFPESPMGHLSSALYLEWQLPAKYAWGGGSLTTKVFMDLLFGPVPLSTFILYQNSNISVLCLSFGWVIFYLWAGVCPTLAVVGQHLNIELLLMSFLEY